jgi:hypothetical protein
VEVFDPASTNALFYICLAYRIGDTESNSSSLRCHENEPSVTVRTNIYLAVVTETCFCIRFPRDVLDSSSIVARTARTHPLCRKRLSAFPGSTLTPPSAFVAVETCSNNSPPMQWIHIPQYMPDDGPVWPKHVVVEFGWGRGVSGDSTNYLRSYI